MITDDTYTVILIRGDNQGEAVHKGADYSEAYGVASAYMARCQRGEFPGVNEVRTVRTDRWGCAHISFRLGTSRR